MLNFERCRNQRQGLLCFVQGSGLYEMVSCWLGVFIVTRAGFELATPALRVRTLTLLPPARYKWYIILPVVSSCLVNWWICIVMRTEKEKTLPANIRYINQRGEQLRANTRLDPRSSHNKDLKKVWYVLFPCLAFSSSGKSMGVKHTVSATRWPAPNCSIY